MKRSDAVCLYHLNGAMRIDDTMHQPSPIFQSELSLSKPLSRIDIIRHPEPDRHYPMNFAPPGPDNHFHADQVRLIAQSYRHWTGEDLLQASLSDPERLGYIAFDAPFALLSHGTEKDPIFNYANRIALEAFGYSWREWISLPSRFSAEAPDRMARQKLLDEVRLQGFSAGYRGIRIGKQGRFEIRAAKVWNLIDEDGNACGQAACFSSWVRIAPET